MQTSNATDTLVLDLSASVEGGALHVRYALINRAGRAIVAFDGATGTGGGPFPDLTGQCYVSFADGAVRVQRIRPSPHPSIDTTRIFMPAVSQIAPQETRRVQFRLPLPVKERSEYTPDYPGATYEQQLVNRLELRIGYFFKTGETVLKPLGTPGVFQAVKGASLSQTFQVAQICPATIDVLVRTDAEFLRM
ncbi:MAG: hypothetical protein ABSG79_15870 [Bryobacteraceae bacterium]|jgi:hypothetical protein